MGNAKIKHVGARFTIVPNAIIDDSGISFRAKGIYAYLRSKPDDWEFRVPNIVRAGKEGRDAIQTVIVPLCGGKERPTIRHLFIGICDKLSPYNCVK